MHGMHGGAAVAWLQENGNPVGALGKPLYGGGGAVGTGGTFTPGNNAVAVGGDQYNRSDAAGATGGGIGGTPAQNAVLDVIKSETGVAGVHVDAIGAKLNGRFGMPEIRYVYSVWLTL